MREISPKTPAAFTLIELLVVVAIISVLATLAMVNYQSSLARTRTSRAHADMRTLTLALESYYVDYNDYPPNPAIPVLDSRVAFDPAPTPTPIPASIQPRGFNITPFHVTTPVAYISSIPRDSFREGLRNVYDIYNSPYDEQRYYYSYYRIISREDWLFSSSRGGVDISLIAVDAAQPSESGDLADMRYLNRGAFQKYGHWVQWGAGPDGILWRAPQDFITPGDPLNALRPPVHPPWGYSFDVPYDPTNGTASFGNIVRTQLGGPRPWASPTPRRPDRDEPPGFPPGLPNAGPRSPDGENDRDPRTRRIPSHADPNGKVADSPEISHDPTDASRDPRVREFEELVESKTQAEPYAHRPWWAFLFLLPTWLWLLLLLMLLLLFLAWLAWHLTRRRRLENRLAMTSATLTDSDLLRIKGINGIERLHLAQSLVTDDGMRYLVGCSALESLNLWGTAITNSALLQINSLPNLKELILSETKVTDAGLPYLSSISSLENLVLTDLPITDAGLLHLRGMTSLKYLNLRSTRVTAGGLAAFMKARPGCEVAHSLELDPATSGRNA